MVWIRESCDCSFVCSSKLIKLWKYTYNWFFVRLFGFLLGNHLQERWKIKWRERQVELGILLAWLFSWCSSCVWFVLRSQQVRSKYVYPDKRTQEISTFKGQGQQHNCLSYANWTQYWLEQCNLSSLYNKLFWTRFFGKLVYQCGKEFHQYLPRTIRHLFEICCERRTNQTREEHDAHVNWFFNVREDGFRIGSRNVRQTNSYKCIFKV